MPVPEVVTSNDTEGQPTIAIGATDIVMTPVEATILAARLIQRAQALTQTPTTDPADPNKSDDGPGFDREGAAAELRRRMAADPQPLDASESMASPTSRYPFRSGSNEVPPLDARAHAGDGAAAEREAVGGVNEREGGS